jgi:hypothetical protein
MGKIPMKSKVLLRIASIVMFLHDVGHTYGHLTWKQASDPIKQEVIKQMTENRFPFMGAIRSLGEYYEGYGYASTIAILFISILLWIFSSSLSLDKNLSKKILIIISAFLLAWGIVELLYFFPFAAAFSLTAMALTVIVFVRIVLDKE